MKEFSIAKILPYAVALAGSILLLVWNVHSVDELPLRIPGKETTDIQPVDEYALIDLKGTLEKFDGVPAALSGIWPRFRGENFDAIFTDERVKLNKKWPADGPKVLWTIDVGEGYAGAAIFQGRVYVLDYDQKRAADTLRCLSLTDGKDIWRYSYPVKVKRNHGMSRTVPAVNEKYVVAMGPKCHVTCLDSQTGEFRWAKDLVRQYGTKVPLWYAGQCPLIDEKNRAIIAPGGKNVLMMAVDCETGEAIWKTPNPNQWKMTHSSIMPMENNGRRIYVYCASGGVVGISAENGKLLWQTDQWKISIANVPSPTIIDHERIFLSGGYNAGSMMIKIKENAEGSEFAYEAEVLFRLKPGVFGAAQHTPILFDGHLYGVRPDEQMVCMNLNGEILWASGSNHKFGIGPFMVANNLMFAMDDNGLLRLIEAAPNSYNQLAEARVLQGHDSWGPMALADGRLIVRDLTKMTCLKVIEN